jgi:peptidoglycan-N-acetylglucosamine deacetylase
MTRLSLTFDNGPNPGATEKILEVLGERGITATFFMVGHQVLALRGEATAQRVLRAGHAIGNHTLNHGPPLGECADALQVATEIGETQEILANLGVQTPLFRPNGRGNLGPHLLNRPMVDYLVRQRFTVVTWNCVVRDWEDPPDLWIERALESIHARNWTVLVLHDEHAAERLEDLIEGALELGAEITNELPRSCVPILGGRVQWNMEGVVANGLEPPSAPANRSW